MVTIRLNLSKTKIIVTLSSGIILGCILLIFLNLSTSLSREDAEKRVRMLLSKEITQRYMATLKDEHKDGFDIDTATQLKEELDRINNFKFVSVDVRRLIPDIVFNPLRPDHVVRIVIQNQKQQCPPRYFLLPWADIDSETSKFLWIMSI